jgi:putative transcriptional regulator
VRALAHRIAPFAALFACAVLLKAVPPVAAEPQSLAGQLLIAETAMGDPRFARTVILMVRHDKDGAFGIVINRPIAERPFADILGALGDKDTAVPGTARLFYGGPVQPELGFVVHSAEYGQRQTIAIDAHVAVTSSRDILHDIATGKGPAKSLIAFGYAGWAAGQLEGELKQRVWVVAPAEQKLIFDADRDKLWDLAYAQRTQDL